MPSLERTILVGSLDDAATNCTRALRGAAHFDNAGIVTEAERQELSGICHRLSDLLHTVRGRIAAEEATP